MYLIFVCVCVRVCRVEGVEASTSPSEGTQESVLLGTTVRQSQSSADDENMVKRVSRRSKSVAKDDTHQGQEMSEGPKLAGNSMKDAKGEGQDPETIHGREEMIWREHSSGHAEVLEPSRLSGATTVTLPGGKEWISSEPGKAWLANYNEVSVSVLAVETSSGELTLPGGKMWISSGPEKAWLAGYSEVCVRERELSVCER